MRRVDGESDIIVTADPIVMLVFENYNHKQEIKTRCRTVGY